MQRVEVGFDVLSDKEKAGLQQKLGRPGGLPEGALAQVSNVVCIGSGKGGVGKSTVTANLAAALTADGKRVGVLDADVWGYSIPRMFGVSGRPPVSPQRKIMPLEGHGVKVMSIGFFVEEDSAVVWRGPMLHKALTQFLEDVEWGELDFLLVDLPPGTGDVSMTLAQLLPQAKFLIVTTPQPVAQKVARRAAEMAHKVDLEIGGVIENMAGFVTPGGERFALFGEGGGQALADELDVPLLGSVPLTMPLREQADAGEPLVFTDPDDPAVAGHPPRRPRPHGDVPGRAADPAGRGARRAGGGADGDVAADGGLGPPSRRRPRRRVASARADDCSALGPAARREVLRVDLRVALPLVGQLVLGEARVHGTGLDAGVAVDALLGVDVEHLDLVVIGLVGGRVDAVHRADLDAGVVLGADARLGDDVRHVLPWVAFGGRSIMIGLVPMTPRLWGERGRRRAIKLGIDPARLPPGQSPTTKFPVLTVGPNAGRPARRLDAVGPRRGRCALRAGLGRCSWRSSRST